MNISRTQGQLTMALFEEELAGIFCLEVPDDLGRTIRELSSITNT